MGASPLVSLILWTFLLTVRGDSGPDCQLNCCPSQTFCCGSFCAPIGSREPFTCVSLHNGCCKNPANVCATSIPPAPNQTPPVPSSNDIIISDGPAISASDTVVSDASPDDASTPTGAPASPCRTDCCVTGFFCCGKKCRAESLQDFLTCPAKSTCCSNPQLICNDPSASTDPPSPAPAPAPAPTPTSITFPIQVESAPSTAPSAETSPSSTAPEADKPASSQAPTADEPGPATDSNAPQSDAASPGPSAAPANSSALCDDGCEPWWGECGGRKYDGPGCCTAGSSCKSITQYFSQCVPDNSSPLCSSGPPESAGAFCQCGGATFLGPQECGPGLNCVDLNAFYSQCRPNCSFTKAT